MRPPILYDIIVSNVWDKELERMMPSSHKYFNIKDDIGRFLKYFTKLPTDPPFIEDKKATKDNVDVRFSIVLNEEG